MKFKKILSIGVDENKIGPDYWKKIDALADSKVILQKDDPQIKENLKDAYCLLVNFGIVVDKKMIDDTPNLKYIGILATAFGKIDVAYAKEKGIVVCNLPGYSTESVAEFTIAAILETIRGLEEGKKRGRAGNVSEEGIKAWEIKDKVFGVLGLGHIGTRVAELALGFNADVRYWSRHKKEDAKAKGIKYEDLDKLISEADFLSLNLPQAPDTKGILNTERLNSLKASVVVINTAPMELVDLDALVERLKKGDITFILDHSDKMAEEDLKKLLPFENCIVYPPMAYITKEAALNKQEMFTSNIESFLNGTPKNTVEV